MSIPANCSNPIDAAVLADYWIGALAEAQEELVEQHLLGCGRCSARLQEVVALADAIKNLARQGSLRMVVSETFLKRMAETGVRVREYTVPAGGGVQCTVTSEDDLLIGRLAANLPADKRIDMCACDERGVEQFRMQDIPVNPGTNAMIYQESIQFAKAAPTFKMIIRLVAVAAGGDEEMIGEYTFNHTRSLPGPGSF